MVLVLKKIFLIICSILLCLIGYFIIYNEISKEEDYYIKKSIDDIVLEIEKEQRVVVYFYKSSCPACMSFRPILNKVIREKSIEVYAVNIDETSYFLENNNIFATPTIIVFEESKDIARNEGWMSEEKLLLFLKIE